MAIIVFDGLDGHFLDPTPIQVLLLAKGPTNRGHRGQVVSLYSDVCGDPNDRVRQVETLKAGYIAEPHNL